MSRPIEIIDFSERQQLVVKVGMESTELWISACSGNERKSIDLKQFLGFTHPGNGRRFCFSKPVSSSKNSDDNSEMSTLKLIYGSH